VLPEDHRNLALYRIYVFLSKQKVRKSLACLSGACRTKYHNLSLSLIIHIRLAILSQLTTLSLSWDKDEFANSAHCLIPKNTLSSLGIALRRSSIKVERLLLPEWMTVPRTSGMEVLDDLTVLVRWLIIISAVSILAIDMWSAPKFDKGYTFEPISNMFSIHCVPGSWSFVCPRQFSETVAGRLDTHQLDQDTRVLFISSEKNLSNWYPVISIHFQVQTPAL
jgi:hypothetical protein